MALAAGERREPLANNGSCWIPVHKEAHAVRSISQIVAQFKLNWLAEIDPAAIEIACVQQGCRWRDRVLTPVVTVQVFMLQILHGNTACTHLAKLAKLCFTGAAVSEPEPLRSY
jgi:hypothetical protein